MTVPFSQDSSVYKPGLNVETPVEIQEQNEHEDVFVLPASFAQQRLWFLEQWEPGVYNIPFSVGLSGKLDINAMERAFQEIIQRHEALRTTFSMVESQLMQVVSPQVPFSLNIIDLQMFSEDVRRTKGRRLIKEEFHRPFDLLHGPLLRVSLLKLKEQSHALFLCMHHIISDAWSMEILFSEFKTLYAAYINGEPSPLPDLPIQYADYAIWQRDWLQGEVLNEQLEYWKKQLAGLPALQLPFDHPRPAIQTFRGAVRNMVVPEKLTSQLNVMSRNAGVTLFMALLGAYQTLLYRYTDQTCIPVGIPIAGRTESNLEPLIGCFINTLVIRTDFDDNPTFLDLLKRVREAAIGAYEHQDIPFEKLVESLQPDRNLSHNPLTQVMFALQNVPQGEVHLPELSFVTLSTVENSIRSGVGANPGQESQLHRAMSENKTAMFDLDMTFWERGDTLLAELKYNTDLFEAETIDRFQGHFLTLLENIVADPKQRINEISLLSAQERELVLEKWNETEVPYPLEHLFHEFVLEQVLSDPMAPAVSDEQEQLSYQELLTRAEHLAAHLQAAGIRAGQEQLLGLYMERSVSWAVAVLATMLAGGVYLPLDPHHPAGRLRYILQHARCRRVLTTRAQAPRLAELLGEATVQVYCIEDLAEQADAAYRPVNYTGAHLAYVIYTSGSTGMPKGVMVEHRGMLNHLLAKVEALTLGPQDIVAQTASHCFDISIWQLLAAWLVGGHVRIYPEQVASDPEALLHRIEADSTSVIETVPSLLRAMLDLLDQGSHEQRPTLPKLRWMVPTGESLGADLAQRWLRYYPRIPLLNAYGPTECSDDVTHYLIDEPLEPEALGRSIPIGSALPNLQLYVLDGQQRPQPVGIWGEIYVGGVGVGRGYLGDPARTAGSFVPDPWGQVAGGRLYRTGDLGRYRSGGVIEFLGRVDHQVKLRGYRIELGEIEQVLRSHAGVRESIVHVCEDEPGRQRLVAYIVPQPGEQPELEDLRQLAREALPEYMVPAAFVQLEAIPLTPNGKVDRQALPTPTEQDSGQDLTGYVAPRTVLESQLVAIWSQLLGVERVGVYDDFFALGGHSLLTVRLVSEIERLCGKRLPLASIFQGRTIDTLAQILSRSAEVETSPWSQALETTSQKVDLPSEATLDLATCPEVWPDEFNAEPANVLLTGASGFLGTFLLADLLKHTSANVYCLVRARHSEHARQKLQRSLEDALEWQPEFSARIKPVIGDLALPRLGLSEETSEELARCIDAIYHNGAQVNMLYPYEELKAANVQGTREIISLATRYRVKPLHYISTLSVFPHKGETRIQYVREQDSLDDFHEHIRDGYAQSKWVAEKIVTIARSRGLPVVIYRPGRITGHSQSGFWRSEDVLYRMIKGCLQLGMCPIFSTNDTLEMTPVDFVSRAIVSLSGRKSSPGQSFHLCCPPGAEARINEIMTWLTSAGYQLQQVQYGAWFAELTRALSNGQENVLAEILPLLPQPGKPPQDASQRLLIVQDNKYTMKTLARAAITCPPVDEHLLRTYIAYMVQNNSLLRSAVL
ncbi:MAG TPA: amino acid adenylation domain-containing protein [Ktedonobacteraceae bacterium]|nr:amino acid adenylation domain-containing protein [Ktedonobacteraceae bacterium]